MAKKSKKTHKGEEVGKPWPGTPLAGTSQNNIHRQINLRKIPNKKGKTKKFKKMTSRFALPRNSEIQEEEEEDELSATSKASDEDVYEEPAKKTKKRVKKSPKTDLLVITVLWTFEMLHDTVYSLREKFIRDSFTIEEEETIEKVTELKFILIYTLLPMLFVGTILTFPCKMPVLEMMQKQKFWIMFGGLSLYSFNTIMGILLVMIKRTSVAIFMHWLDVSWYISHPIRYWFIFHQQFPMSIRWSHLIASGHILAVGVLEYIVKIFVTEAEYPLSKTAYLVSFCVAVGGAAAWIAGFIFIYRFLNPISEKMKPMREFYQTTEVIENFNRRQKFASVVIFLALIYPAVIFSVIKAYIEIGHVRLIQNAINPDLGVATFRPDLFCALIVLMILEAVPQFLIKWWNALCDLIVIAFSHLINIIVVLMIMVILYNTKNVRKRGPEKDEAILLVNSNIVGEELFIQVGDDISQWHDNTSFLIIKTIPEDKIIEIRFVKRYTGEVIHSENVDIEVSRNSSVRAMSFLKYGANYYLFRIGFSNLTYSYNARVILMSFLTECTNYDKDVYGKLKFDERNTSFVKVNRICIPLSLQYCENACSRGSETVKPPPYYGILRYEHDTCVPKKLDESNSTRLCSPVPVILNYYRLSEYIKQARNITPSIRDMAKNFTFEVARLRPYKFILVILREKKDHMTPWVDFEELMLYRTEGETSLVILMTLYGVSLGLASVSYIHFMWIQSPIKGRMFVLASFFALHATATSLTKFYLTKFNENAVLTLFICGLFCFLWHLGFTTLFALRWKTMDKLDRPKQGWRRY